MADDVATGELEKMLRCVNGAEIGIYPKARGIGVYFLAPEDALLTHVHDDRGADVVGAPERLKPLFDAYRAWLLDYDLLRMQRMFGTIIHPDVVK